MPWPVIVLLGLGWIGHAALCVAAVNNIHATGMPRWAVGALTHALQAVCLLLPVGFGWWLYSSFSAQDLSGSGDWPQLSVAIWVYACVCWLVALLWLPLWALRGMSARPPAALISNHTETIDLTPLIDPQERLFGLGRCFAYWPGNEVLQLDVNEKTLAIPRLDPALDGMTIAHISDLHFTGRIGKVYFQETIRRVNEMGADLTAITGDIVERPGCLDWIPETLGRLRAPLGVYFVLGNHDTRISLASIRSSLTACGLADLGGRCRTLETRGRRIVVAGNELPWIAPAADLSNAPPRFPGGPNRILLAHTPDQLRWARANDFDLMLAGHTHGGQIQLPPLGPLVAPSHFGVKYASGVFFEPPTVMHVSRGMSSLLPLRWNCRPEATRLVLRAGNSGAL